MKGKKAWRRFRTVARSLPTVPLFAHGHHVEAAGDADWVADGADRHLGDQGGDLGIELVWAHPAGIAALQGGLALAEFGRHDAERRAGAQLGNHGVGEAAGVAGVCRVFGCDEDLSHAVLRLALLRLEQLLLLVDFPVAYAATLSELLAEHACPAELAAYLADEGGEGHALGAELGAQAAWREAVALLDVADGVRHVDVRHDDLAVLDFLGAQLVVDQLAGDLRAEFLKCIRRDRLAGGDCEEAGPVVHVGAGDDVAVHHRHDAVCVRVHDGGGWDVHGRRHDRLLCSRLLGCCCHEAEREQGQGSKADRVA